MEAYNPEKAAQVWQRVRSTALPEALAAGLPTLIAGEWSDAATYLQLSRRFQGRDAAILRRMFEEEQSHAACLKGIYSLLTGERTVTRTPPAAQEPLEVTLRKCYGREMHCLAEYEQHTAHKEYGMVFQRLAEQEREHCRALLELLGKLKQK
jgi:rubrerythrin